MDDGEYEKRLPAIREARRLVLEKYNMFAQTAAVIRNHRGTGIVRPGAILKGRHVLRKNPVNAVRELTTRWPIKSGPAKNVNRNPGITRIPAVTFTKSLAPLPIKRAAGGHSGNCLAAGGARRLGTVVGLPGGTFSLVFRQLFAI